MIHYNDSDFLCHYGVPGMKWGVRKQRILVGRKSRGNRSVNQKKTAKKKSKTGKVLAGAALVAAAGVTLAVAAKTKNVNVGQKAVNAILKANYNAGRIAGRTVATGRAIKANPSGYGKQAAKVLGKKASNAISKGVYKTSYAAGRTVATAQALKNSPVKGRHVVNAAKRVATAKLKR